MRYMWSCGLDCLEPSSCTTNGSWHTTASPVSHYCLFSLWLSDNYSRKHAERRHPYTRSKEGVRCQEFAPWHGVTCHPRQKGFCRLGSFPASQKARLGEPAGELPGEGGGGGKCAGQTERETSEWFGWCRWRVLGAHPPPKRAKENLTGLTTPSRDKARGRGVMVQLLACRSHHAHHVAHVLLGHAGLCMREGGLRQLHQHVLGDLPASDRPHRSTICR